MLIDLCFFGIPLCLAIVLGALAVRDQDNQFWPPSFSIFAYCVFYLAGGREVLLWLIASAVGMYGCPLFP
jgi:hypothetical protein